MSMGSTGIQVVMISRSGKRRTMRSFVAALVFAICLAVFSLAVNPSNSGILYAGTVGRSVQQYTIDLTLPFIASTTFDGKKVITIQRRSFGQNSTVLINGVDKTEFVKTSGDAKITMKGKAKKFGLVNGANSIQVRTSGGIVSNTFTVTK